MKKHRVLANMLESHGGEILALARSLGSQKEEPMFANAENNGRFLLALFLIALYSFGCTAASRERKNLQDQFLQN